MSFRFYGDRILYSAPSSIGWVDAAGGPLQLVWHDQGAQYVLEQGLAHAGSVVVAAYTALYRMNEDGSKRRRLFADDGSAGLAPLAIHGDRLDWIVSGGSQAPETFVECSFHVMEAHLDARTPPRVIACGPSGPERYRSPIGPVVRDGQLLWAAAINGEVRQLALPQR